MYANFGPVRLQHLASAPPVANEEHSLITQGVIVPTQTLMHMLFIK